MVSKTAKPPIPPDHDPTHDAVDDPSILYPSSDGAPMAETEWQYTPLTETVSTLRVRYHHRHDVYVGGDMLLYYRINRNDISVAPDVFVVFGANGTHPRDSWILWREGKAPDFIMEIASSSTWRRDATEKRRIYADIGVTEYVRFDPTGHYFTPPLIMETLRGTDYQEQPVTTDAAGILRGYSSALKLELCVTPSLELRLYDPATAEWLRNHQETETARRAAEIARRASDDARRVAEAENARLREELRRLQQQR